MPRFSFFCAIFGMAVFSPVECTAHPIDDQSFFNESNHAFDGEPISMAGLQKIYGGTLGTYNSEYRRSISDDAAISLLQQTGATSNAAMDEWWVQTGAALIVNNVLGSR